MAITRGIHPFGIPPGPLQVRLFGEFEVWQHGAPLPRLRSRKEYRLFALLILRHDRLMERPWLAGTLWPDSSDTQALANLRNSLKAIRRALGAEAYRLFGPTPRTLELELAGATVDVFSFDGLIGTEDPALLKQAVALYRGPLLEGWTEEWLFEERQAREGAYLAALEKLARHAQEQGQPAEAERYLRRATAADPLGEAAHRALMATLAGSGQYAAAEGVYRDLRLRLYRELNAEPDPETEALFRQLRTEARQRAGGGAGHPRASGHEPLQRAEPPTPAMRRGVSQHTCPPQPATSEAASVEELPLFVLQRALAGGPLVGRQAELDTLQRQIAAAARGEGGTVILAGEPGIGKTRLAREASAAARERGFLVLWGRCEEEGVAPYQPFAQALRHYLEEAEPGQLAETLPSPVASELVRLVPRIGALLPEVARVPPAAGEQARAMLLEAAGEFCALLNRHSPFLLVLEDLHWAEAGSMALLHHLARQGRNLSLLILATYRDVELQPGHPLERAMARLNRERLSQSLSLRRLPEAGVGEMVMRAFGSRPSTVNSAPDGREPTGDGSMGAFVAALYRETEGNPFFVEEVLKHLVEEGAIFQEEGLWQIRPVQELSVPPSVKVTIGRRLERLSEASRQALTMAAVIGQGFGFEVLRQASQEQEERLLDRLDEWREARLVVEDRDRAAHPHAGTRPRRGYPEGETVRERYRFHHALIREVLYEELSLPRRARLHERVGLALEAVSAGALEEPLDELAHHFAHAHTEAAREKGVDYARRAGEQALNLYLADTAIQHLTTALALLDGLPHDERHLRQRWDAAFLLARAHWAYRAFERGQEVLHDYLALAERAGYGWGKAAAHCGIARGYDLSHWAAGSADTEGSRRILMPHLEKSLQIAEAHGLTDWQARARERLAWFLWRARENLPRVEAALRQTLQAPHGVSQKVVQDTCQLLMNVYAGQGKWDDVTALLRQSISLGEPRVVNWCLWHMEEGLNRLGKRAQFVAFCDEARALYSQAGLRPALNQWYLEPGAPDAEFRLLLYRDDFDAPQLRPEWQWHDPAQVSAYSLAESHLALRPGSGVDLHPDNNLNAPRILIEARGDFAVETKMPAHGREGSGKVHGLLVWKDVLNYVRLDRTPFGLSSGEIGLEARVAGTHEVFGRGQFSGDANYLRLERTGERFAALCSSDGSQWLTCGHVVLPVKDPLWVGVWAGHGMVAHFDYVQLLGRG